MSRLTNKNNFNCLYHKIDNDDLFKNRSKISTFLLRPFFIMINLEVDRISLQQLEYGMDRTDYLVDNIFFK